MKKVKTLKREDSMKSDTKTSERKNLRIQSGLIKRELNTEIQRT